MLVFTKEVGGGREGEVKGLLDRGDSLNKNQMLDIYHWKKRE